MRTNIRYERAELEALDQSQLIHIYYFARKKTKLRPKNFRKDSLVAYILKVQDNLPHLKRQYTRSMGKPLH